MGNIGSPEISIGHDGEKAKNQSELNDMIEINILGIFDDFSIVNVENEFQDFYPNLQNNEIQWRGFWVSFYKPSSRNRFEINFRIKCRFEQIGDTRAQALDFIHELGGTMGDIQSSTLASL